MPCDAPVMTATLRVELMMSLLHLRKNAGGAVASYMIPGLLQLAGFGRSDRSRLRLSKPLAMSHIRPHSVYRSYPPAGFRLARQSAEAERSERGSVAEMLMSKRRREGRRLALRRPEPG